ncbi:hypothetical protein AAG906_019584 [Vitis piasezkii]
MMNRHPVPSLDACLSELSREEQHIVTQATMEHQANVRSRHACYPRCFSCKYFGHIARDCPKKFYNYCKKQGHIISACPIRPERKQGTAYHASISASSSAKLPTASSVVPIPVPTDQVSGKMIAKGPKVGRLFPLHVFPSTIIPSFRLLSFACNVVGSGHKMWHRRLGHPNSDAMEHECWQNSMQAKLQALGENHTWDIVPCPPTIKPIGIKWVFSVKLRSDGSLDLYKARLVALAIAASQSWQLHQMDVKNDFLHGDLQEEIYMKLPSGMANSYPHDVCSPTCGLFFLVGSSLQLVAYSDADWVRCPNTLDLLRVGELRFPQTTSTPLHVDNTSAIQIATNPLFHERTKHIEVDCHSIRDTLESRVISLPHISSDLQVADIFTKALTRQRHLFLVGKLLLVDFPSSI